VVLYIRPPYVFMAWYLTEQNSVEYEVSNRTGVKCIVFTLRVLYNGI